MQQLQTTHTQLAQQSSSRGAARAADASHSTPSSESLSAQLQPMSQLHLQSPSLSQLKSLSPPVGPLSNSGAGAGTARGSAAGGTGSLARNKSSINTNTMAESVASQDVASAMPGLTLNDVSPEFIDSQRQAFAALYSALSVSAGMSPVAIWELLLKHQVDAAAAVIAANTKHGSNDSPAVTTAVAGATWLALRCSDAGTSTADLVTQLTPLGGMYVVGIVMKQQHHVQLQQQQLHQQQQQQHQNLALAHLLAKQSQNGTATSMQLGVNTGSGVSPNTSVKGQRIAPKQLIPATIDDQASNSNSNTGDDIHSSGPAGTRASVRSAASLGIPSMRASRSPSPGTDTQFAPSMSGPVASIAAAAAVRRKSQEMISAAHHSLFLAPRAIRVRRVRPEDDGLLQLPLGGDDDASQSERLSPSLPAADNGEDNSVVEIKRRPGRPRKDSYADYDAEVAEKDRRKPQNSNDNVDYSQATLVRPRQPTSVLLPSSLATRGIHVIAASVAIRLARVRAQSSPPSAETALAEHGGRNGRADATTNDSSFVLSQPLGPAAVPRSALAALARGQFPFSQLPLHSQSMSVPRPIVGSLSSQKPLQPRQARAHAALLRALTVPGGAPWEDSTGLVWRGVVPTATQFADTPKDYAGACDDDAIVVLQALVAASERYRRNQKRINRHLLATNSSSSSSNIGFGQINKAVCRVPPPPTAAALAATDPKTLGPGGSGTGAVLGVTGVRVPLCRSTFNPALVALSPTIAAVSGGGRLVRYVLPVVPSSLSTSNDANNDGNCSTTTSGLRRVPLVEVYYIRHSNNSSITGSKSHSRSHHLAPGVVNTHLRAEIRFPGGAAALRAALALPSRALEWREQFATIAIVNKANTTLGANAAFSDSDTSDTSDSDSDSDSDESEVPRTVPDDESYEQRRARVLKEFTSLLYHCIFVVPLPTTSSNSSSTSASASAMRDHDSNALYDEFGDGSNIQIASNYATADVADVDAQSDNANGDDSVWHFSLDDKAPSNSDTREANVENASSKNAPAVVAAGASMLSVAATAAAQLPFVPLPSTFVLPARPAPSQALRAAAIAASLSLRARVIRRMNRVLQAPRRGRPRLRPRPITAAAPIVVGSEAALALAVGKAGLPRGLIELPKPWPWPGAALSKPAAAATAAAAAASGNAGMNDAATGDADAGNIAEGALSAREGLGRVLLRAAMLSYHPQVDDSLLVPATVPQVSKTEDATADDVSAENLSDSSETYAPLTQRALSSCLTIPFILPNSDTIFTTVPAAYLPYITNPWLSHGARKRGFLSSLPAPPLPSPRRCGPRFLRITLMMQTGVTSDVENRYVTLGTSVYDVCAQAPLPVEPDAQYIPLLVPASSRKNRLKDMLEKNAATRDDYGSDSKTSADRSPTSTTSSALDNDDPTGENDDDDGVRELMVKVCAVVEVKIYITPSRVPALSTFDAKKADNASNGHSTVSKTDAQTVSSSLSRKNSGGGSSSGDDSDGSTGSGTACGTDDEDDNDFDEYLNLPFSDTPFTSNQSNAVDNADTSSASAAANVTAPSTLAEEGNLLFSASYAMPTSQPPSQKPSKDSSTKDTTSKEGVAQDDNKASQASDTASKAKNGVSWVPSGSLAASLALLLASAGALCAVTTVPVADRMGGTPVARIIVHAWPKQSESCTESHTNSDSGDIPTNNSQHLPSQRYLQLLLSLSSLILPSFPSPNGPTTTRTFAAAAATTAARTGDPVSLAAAAEGVAFAAVTAADILMMSTTAFSGGEVASTHAMVTANATAAAAGVLPSMLFKMVPREQIKGRRPGKTLFLSANADMTVNRGRKRALESDEQDEENNGGDEDDDFGDDDGDELEGQQSLENNDAASRAVALGVLGRRKGSRAMQPRVGGRFVRKAAPSSMFYRLQAHADSLQTYTSTVNSAESSAAATGTGADASGGNASGGKNVVTLPSSLAAAAAAAGSDTGITLALVDTTENMNTAHSRVTNTQGDN
mgnify:CR=1 FL=1